MQDYKQYLNPLYKDLKNIANFSDVTNKEISETERNEYPHLEKVTNIIAKTVEKHIQKLEELEIELEKQIERIDMESGIDDKKDAVSVYNKILKSLQDEVERINKDLIALDAPYFGKIVFSPTKSTLRREINTYIGKFALMDENTQIPLVTDWRAPIANIYYENSGPTDGVFFDSPMGRQEGDLKQKRQFQISKARINSIYDAKSGNAAADAFLLAQLNEKLGKKLTDIVSTIQEQQNKIIREEINKPAIIQGVAGSGKTTIILHRLAYLFYAHKNDIDPKRSLVIAPNTMFLDYISDVLPNLGVTGVQTQTYLFWAKSIMDWDDSYMLSPKEENLKYKEFKGSKEFIDILDTYFDNYEERLFDDIPYSRREDVRERYQYLQKNSPQISFLEKLDLSLDYAFAQRDFDERRLGLMDSTQEFREEKKREMRNYFRRNTNPFEMYKRLFKTDLVSKDISKYSLEGIKKEGKNHLFRMEDIAPILYLFFKLRGVNEFKHDYIVVDEAQDLSLIQIYTLFKVAKNNNITLAGDLAQSIIPPFYIKDWNVVLDIFKEHGIENYSYHQLNRCYRTTVEIIEFANKIFKKRFPESYKLPEAVLRHGDDVLNIKTQGDITEGNVKDIKDIASILNKHFKDGAATCAVVCRDREHAEDVVRVFKDNESLFNREIVSFEEVDYKTGIQVLPIEKAKGLEFDTVVLVDLDNIRYEDTELNTRLLYVGITRALHHLVITCSQNIPSSGILRI